MKKTVLKIISLIMSVVLTFTAVSIGSGALETEKAPVTDNAPAVISAASSLIPMDSFAGIFAGMEKLTSFEAFGNNVMKVIYNGLNVVVEILCRVICAATPNPKDWKSITMIRPSFSSGFIRFIRKSADKRLPRINTFSTISSCVLSCRSRSIW